MTEPETNCLSQTCEVDGLYGLHKIRLLHLKPVQQFCYEAHDVQLRGGETKAHQATKEEDRVKHEVGFQKNQQIGLVSQEQQQLASDISANVNRY